MRRVDAEPDAHPEQLHGYQAEGDDQLRCRGDEPRSADRHLALLKNPVDPIGLGQQCRIADTHPQAQENPSQGAYEHVRGGDHKEGGSVAQEDAREQDVTQLSTRSLDDGGVVVSYKGSDHKHSGHDSQDSDEKRDDRPRRAPLQLNNGDGVAASVIPIGPRIKATHFTGVSVCLILVAIAVLTVPAARNPLHDFLPLPRAARLAAYRRGDFLRRARPLHLISLGRKTQLYKPLQ